MSELDLSADQKYALRTLWDWYKANKSSSSYITLGGLAGTGKTTIISILRHYLDKNNPDLPVAFCTFTGKASRVLNNNLKQFGSIFRQDYCGTIHSLVYKAVSNSKGEIIRWDKKDKLDYSLIIVDEASMVNKFLWDDLRSYNLPIIAVGDHGQLPPIGSDFDLMKEPHIRLEQIHRQVAGNPILEIAYKARETGIIEAKKYSDKVIKYNKEDSDIQNEIETKLLGSKEDTIVLCGYNHTKFKLNRYIRTLFLIEEPEPQVKDKVIVLKNNYKSKVFNGMTGQIKSIYELDEETYQCDIKFENEDKLYSGKVLKEPFIAQDFNSKNVSKDFDVVDFGYAITVHKAQGSQSRKVILFEERMGKMDDATWKRWLYTAVTRAQDELYIF